MIVPQNLIVNSNFTDNKCDQNYCVWNQQKYYDYVRGWQPRPRIQVGNGNIYVSYIQSQHEKVIMLRYNQCIIQKIPKIQIGQLILTIKWAAKKKTNFNSETSSIQIYNNNKLITNQTTNSYLQKTYTTNITNNGCQLFQIKICGINSVLIFVQLIGTPIVKNIVNVPNQVFSGFLNPETIINFMTYECVQKIYTLDEDYYELSFSYKALMLSQWLKTHLIVYWNGNIINIRVPIDQMKYLLKFQVIAIQGVNNLTFCPSVCQQEQIYHQIFIDNSLSMIKRSCLGDKHQNILNNSGFDDNKCIPGILKFCQVIPSRYLRLGLNYWDICTGCGAQISHGDYYQDQLPHSFVFNLVVILYDVCVSQSISNLNIGNYILQIDWIGRNKKLSSNDFNISIQNYLIKRINVTDFDFHHEVIYFRLNQSLINTKLTICGCGNGNWNGAHVDNVKLFYVGC